MNKLSVDQRKPKDQVITEAYNSVTIDPESLIHKGRTS
jgi:hypothetical protein